MSTGLVTPFLPTVERLRAHDVTVPSDEPAVVERLSLLIVKAALMRRSSWAEETLTVPGYLEQGEPPPPKDYEQRHHVRIEERFGSITCLACVNNPGRRRCRVCRGKSATKRGDSCSCKDGWIACPTCQGNQQTERVRLRYYTDAPGYLNEAYMPTYISQDPSLFGLETIMEEELGVLRSVPEELRCHDLTGEVVGTAYRGGQRVVRPQFHGHDFGDTIDKARAGLSAVAGGGNVVLYQIHAYAWPFLRLRWQWYASMVVYLDRWGGMKVFHGKTIPEG